MTDQKEATASKADKFLVRLPDGMRERLKVEAANSNRSLNSEIIVRLESTLSNGLDVSAIGDGGKANLDRVAEFIVAAIKAEGRKQRGGPTEKIVLAIMNQVVDLVSSVSQSIGEKLPDRRLIHFALNGYNDLLSLVTDPMDENEIKAFLPAVRFRIEQAMTRKA
jgi:plasmid stability protein